MRWKTRCLVLVLPFTLFACSGGGGENVDETAPEAGEPGVVSGPQGRWEWISFQGMDDGTLDVSDPTLYTLEIRDDGASIRADCNTGTGSLELEGPQLQFGPIATTMMACPDASLADRYLKYLEYVRSWVLENGHLYLSLYADGGIMEFRPAAS